MSSIGLTHSDVDATVETSGVRIVATATTTGATGVEMEALTAVSIAALTVYDMTQGARQSHRDSGRIPALKNGRKERRLVAAIMIRVLVVTISDSGVAGTRVDRSGPAVSECVEQLGWTVAGRELIADETHQISELLRSAADAGQVDVILTTGGTGVAPRDVTPEATRAVIEREVPGLPEVMRAEGRKQTYLAPLSRAVAGTRKRTLIVNLPGSPKGAVESLNAIARLIPHITQLMNGRTEHEPASRNSTVGENVN